jgi:hypothetical protein
MSCDLSHVAALIAALSIRFPPFRIENGNLSKEYEHA